VKIYRRLLRTNGYRGEEHLLQILEKDLKEFLTIAELSEYLSIKPSSLYSMAERREIPCFRFGRLIRFKREEIDMWIENHREKTIDPAEKGRKILGKVKDTRMDINALVKKTIEDVKDSGYNLPHGKPNRIKGLRKEVENGTL
jgi:excisionase family DNA binding protein